MPRHSKNNTASSVFTYHETKSLDYGTKKQRIGRDSFREYNACFLCLQTARDPVACPEGHLACRECMYESILQQKQNIKREQRLMEQKVRDLDNLKARETEEAKQALLDDFEKTQTSMLGRRAPRAATATASTTENSINSSPSSAQKNGSESGSGNTTPSAGTKRKFELTEDVVKEAADKELDKASKRLAEEKARASAPKLSSFWLPSLTPEAEKQLKDEIKPISTQTMCLATKTPHPVSLKTLIEVKFQQEEGNKSKCQCPACLKTLNNSVKFSVMRNCGHVICNTCVDMFVKKSKRCYVCEKKTKSKDIVDMSAEGTGFASGSSMAMATKWDVAFQ
ncbi:zinc finger nitric oxide synthase-interactingprotein [Lichtheimia corymbifera JMRC:FSU:9682]|uniref:Zinc finger nitric oxide synthase-interactingprotein n=1 Tax=Lichtheimia corymbifera JMRC:FSU:9682 TaxID=1263082 RepID=A0A068RKA4_9FUNG|nr:zinc finger nitric oxide synthase-interactingprotein [Lichtheimia corymbifera JMRC:FSU:9682]